MAKVLKIWHFSNIEICESTSNGQKFVTQQKCILKTQKKNESDFSCDRRYNTWLDLTWKRIIKHYFEDVILKTFQKF